MIVSEPPHEFHAKPVEFLKVVTHDSLTEFAAEREKENPLVGELPVRVIAQLTQILLDAGEPGCHLVWPHGRVASRSR